MIFSLHRNLSRSGLSLAEMLMTISMIGILSAIAVVTLGDLKSKSESSIGKTRLEQLNDAVKEYEQNAWPVNLAADDNSGDDELAILRSLQWRSSTAPSWGSPYFDPRWVPTVSSDEAAYRYRWDGSYFSFLEPGESGTGLLYNPDEPESGTPYTYPVGYEPVGHP